MKKIQKFLLSFICLFLIAGYTPIKAEVDSDVEVTVFNYADILSGDEIYNVGNPLQRIWIGYSLRNFRVISQNTLPTIIRSSSLAPSGSHTFTITRTQSTTGSVGLAFSVSDVNASLGFSKSNSVTIEDKFSYKCPTKRNGRTVSSCQVNYKPQTSTYRFEEYFLERKNATWQAVVLTGIAQEVTFRY